MPRILRSQGIYYLGKYVPAAPAVTFVAPPIRTQLAAVPTRDQLGRCDPTTYGYIVPVVISAPPLQARVTPLSQDNAVANRLLPPYRRTVHFLRPPTVVTAAVVFVAPPIRKALTRTRPRRTVYTLRRPTTLKVFTGPPPRLTKARPRPTTHILRPAAVVLNPGNEQRIRTLRVALVRGRPGKTRFTLRPPAVVAAAVTATFEGPRSTLARIRTVRTTYLLGRTPLVEAEAIQLTIRVIEVRTRPRHTTAVLRPTIVATAFVAPPLRVALTRTRPKATITALFPPAVVAPRPLAPAVQSRLVRTRPRHTVYRLQQPTVLRTFQGPSKRTVTTRPRHTTRVLYAPAVVTPVAAFVAAPLRVKLVRIRPPRTRADLAPPAVVAPTPLAPPPASRLVRTRPRHTVYRLEAPTVLAVFTGPRSELTKARPRPTTTVLVPAQVVRNPHVEQQLRTLRVRLVTARPRPTITLLRPPAVVLINPPVVTELRVFTVRGRRPVAKTRLFRPATLEPFSIQLREQTIRVALVRIRPRKTTLKLRPPARLAVLTFATGKPVLVRTRPRRTRYSLEPPTVLRVFSTGETRLVTTRPRPTTTVLRPAAVVRVPSVDQEARTLRVALTQTRPRATTTLLRPPTVVRQPPAVTQIRTRLTPGRRPVARTYLQPPAVVTPFVPPAVAFLRPWLVRIRPPKTLWQLFPPSRLKTVPGTACLTDQLANQACLTDQLAAEACLEDEEGKTEACLTDQAQAVACLVDMSAATATLRDEE